MLRKLAVLCLVVLLASCASAPPPASQSTNPGSDSRAKALVQGGLDAGAPAPAPAPSAPAPAAGASPASALAPAQADAPPPPPGQLTPEEQAFLQNYLSRLNYMVYYSEDAKLEPRLAKIAVSQANRYLIEQMGLSVIDFDQIERNKKDQQAAYQSETGGSIDLIQYLAQKLNADVYVELDFSVSSETRDGKFYASAQGTMKIYDTSTAALLGSVAFMSQPAFSPSSMDAAVANAIAASVWTAMPKMTSQAKELIKNSLSRGVRYELLVQNTPDARALSNFRRSLAKKLREVEQVSYSPAETKFYLYSFQGRDKVEDAVYDAAPAAGLADIYLVYMRGKSFTFNSGM